MARPEIDPESLTFWELVRLLRPGHLKAVVGSLVAMLGGVAVIAGWGGAVLSRSVETHRVEQLEARVTAVEDRSQRRLVTNTESDAMIAELRRLASPEYMDVACPLNDAETCELAAQFVEIFVRGGWHASLSHAGVAGRGIVIEANSQQTKHADTALGAFEAAGLRAALRINDNRNGIFVLVANPNPRAGMREPDARLVEQ